ncbi:hypothetical protein UFOVP1666_165 [uncultured Caudovirales phage]|uniref:Uncharacterized protein n=1 Tax=uncultured Caudovirales phage TaxID=2100421 RepID=A0A6J5T660_9CAUD|nr:hypothetical protein UFOVP867_120 [uncultured Caudovirales phage]CAB4170660.1 hypothetical protein UFOVP913_78 [uncultured Caudovirales phage]CAB4177020.1 hypothetical protein UFOVP993_131 [uncultured Caudovirales phage]CAB4223265.1 hypothetical protein UFOVP1666_165 [uncultured Caudovirales phage]
MSWILNFIPDALILQAINILLLAGAIGSVIGFAVTFIPFIGIYRLPIQIVSIILLTAGVYFKGMFSAEDEWKSKIAKVEAENVRILAESKTSSQVIVTKYVDKIKYIVTKGDSIVKEVPIYITKELDAKCEIPDEFIRLHNAAATNK